MSGSAARPDLTLPHDTDTGFYRHSSDAAISLAHRGRMLVNLKADGSLEYGDGYTPDAAARVFWEAVASARPRYNQDNAEP